MTNDNIETPAPASTADDIVLDDLLTDLIGDEPAWSRLVIRNRIRAAGFVRGDVAKAEALEEAANDVSGYSAEYWRHSEEQRYFRPWHANWLRSRAAEYRAAAQKGDEQ